MTVLLATSRHPPGADSYETWCRACGVTTQRLTLDPEREIPDRAIQLEKSFDGIAKTWAELGRTLAEDASAALAHAPACATNASDMGLMLAWSRLVGAWAKATGTTLVICDDPWMFRQFAGLEAVRAGRPPRLWTGEMKLALRGWAGRIRVALRAGVASLALRRGRRDWKPGDRALLVYGHPQSMASGEDAYFGPLMDEMPGLRRMLHVDCPPSRARQLAGPRTASLHGWGNPFAALSLPFARWRPSARHPGGEFGWIVRRAAAIEGGSGQSAMIRWQQICQNKWLRHARPGVVAWPWENHAWERQFVRAARAVGTRTVGYQHATIGNREWNYAPDSNFDGLAGIPDLILANGPLGHRTLLGYGYPEDLIAIGGALRLRDFEPLPHDPDAPVFVALPFDGRVAEEMVDAIRPLGLKGKIFLVRDHPMTPLAFTESPGVSRCTTPLQAQDAVSAVIYAGTSVGLEAVLGGLPTIRFQPGDGVIVDAMPETLDVPAANSAMLETILDGIVKPAAIGVETMFSRPDMRAWRDALPDTAPEPDGDAARIPTGVGAP